MAIAYRLQLGMYEAGSLFLCNWSSVELLRLHLDCSWVRRS